MNIKTPTIFLLVASLSGCVVSSTRNGDVQFTWSFGGLTCSDVPQITSVSINIPGELLQNNGVYPCSTNNYPGIVLQDFLPGTYSFTIQALDQSGTAFYSASGSFTVDGSISVRVDLSPTALLTWSFPPNRFSQNPNCSQASVDFVDVAIDQGQPQRYRCTQGQMQPGAPTPLLNPGTHTISFTAFNQNVNYPFARFMGLLQTTASGPVAGNYQLQWVVGGVTVQWSISGATCANIPSVYVNFRDANGNYLYPGWDRHDCVDGLAPGGSILYDLLPPGNYNLILQETPYSSALYSNYPYPPVTITSGYFSDSQTVRSTIHP